MFLSILSYANSEMSHLEKVDGNCNIWNNVLAKKLLPSLEMVSEKASEQS